MSVVEALAKSLWEIGNRRIGHRPWETVADTYLAEAQEALDTLSLAGYTLGTTDLEAELATLHTKLSDLQLAIADTEDDHHGEHTAWKQEIATLRSIIRRYQSGWFLSDDWPGKWCHKRWPNEMQTPDEVAFFEQEAENDA